MSFASSTLLMTMPMRMMIDFGTDNTTYIRAPFFSSSNKHRFCLFDSQPKYSAKIVGNQISTWKRTKVLTSSYLCFMCT